MVAARRASGIIRTPELRDGWIQPPLLGDKLVWVAYGPDGKTAELVAWDSEKQAIGWKMPLDGNVPERVYSHDGKRVVGARWDTALREWKATTYDGPGRKVLNTWDISDTQQVVSNRRGGSPPITLSGDGKTLYAGFDGIACFNVDSGKETARVVTGRIEPVQWRMVFPLVASADGIRLAVIGKEGAPNDGTIRVFDASSGKKLMEQNEGNLYAPVARFSPNGKRLAVWNARDYGVRLYEIGPGSELRKFEGSSRPSCVAFNPDGSTLAVGYHDGTALVWEITAK